MPHNREKDYTIRTSDKKPVTIDEYRVAPWRQLYAGTMVDFRRWLYVGRPDLDVEGRALPEDNTHSPLVNAGRNVMVEGFRDAVWHMKGREALSKRSYCLLGARNWFEYLDYRLAAGRPVFDLADITKEVIEGFIHWLKNTKDADTENGRLSFRSAKAHYEKLKTILQQLVYRSALPNGIFPRNPFPHSNRSGKGHIAYPEKVMKALMAGLFRAIKAVREGELILSETSRLALYLMVIAARTGRNTWPLLELTRDALMPHPIKPDKLGILVTYKRRGHNTAVQAFEKPADIEDMISLPMDALTLYKEALELTAPYITEVSPELRNRLWLFRKTGSRKGEIGALSAGNLHCAVQQLVKRLALEEDEKPLRLNTSRLRKTFSQRIWQLSDGDIITTAKELGNTPVVADQTYVAVTPDMVANFRRLGILMHADWAGKMDDLAFLEELAIQTGLPASVLRDIAVGYNNTGVGRCIDPRLGGKATGNGQLCTKWLECFKCENQLVMESDLYRLYSFYFLLLKERNFISRQKWNDLYWPIIVCIDDEVVTPNLKTKSNPKGCFDPYRVKNAKEKAEADPHPMWRDRAILGRVQ